MRSPRRIDFDHPALSDTPLNDQAPPPDDSISWKLWLASHDVAHKALSSDYIQGVKKGTLAPTTYGRYSIQDAVYCYHAQADYQALESRATADGDLSLAAFAKARYDGYVQYTAETFEDWHIADAKAISPGSAARTYIELEHHIASQWSPIYGVIAMIPCEQLWAWLGSSLKSHATPGNLYSSWITENDDWSGGYRLDNFVDDWLAEHPEAYDWESALFVFQSCMTCEANFFRSACGQEVLPMPTKKNP